MQLIKNICCSLTVVAALGIGACSKMDEYKKYTAGKENYYPRKIDSVRMLSGQGRVILTGIIADPNIVKVKVLWNLDNNSAEFSVNGDAKHINEEISLPEGVYDFRIFTYDRLGNRSVPVFTTGTSYDAVFQNSLTERKLKQAGQDGNDAILEWYDAVNALGGVKVKYVDADGKSHTLTITNAEDKMILTNFEFGDSFQYATWGLPDSIAIDTFYTDFVTQSIDKRYEIELDRSLFEPVFLPGDVNMTPDRPIPNMWDGDLVSNGNTSQPADGQPKWFTFDLGVTARLSRFSIYTYPHVSNYFDAITMRLYEIWGSNDPNPDGSWDSSWTKLVTHENIKPSGLPRGQLNDTDIAAAEAGDNGTFPLDIPPVRYIRIKCLYNWSGIDNSNLLISELYFWGSVR